jgi:hypothetical protein
LWETENFTVDFYPTGYPVFSDTFPGISLSRTIQLACDSPFLLGYNALKFCNPSEPNSFERDRCLIALSGSIDARLAVSLVGGTCTATLTLTNTTNTFDITGRRPIPGRPFFILPSSYQVEYATGAIGAASATRTFTCVSDLVGMSVSLSPFGSADNLPASGGNISWAAINSTLSITGVSLIP